MEQSFGRRLSPELMALLEQGGEIDALVPAVANATLDVQIRENALHVYSGQSRVLSIERGGFGFIACIHHKFLVDVCLPGAESKRGEYRCYPMRNTFVAEYLRQLHPIVEHAAQYGKAEGAIEHQIIRGSVKAGAPMVVVDRQVQVHGRPGRADMVGVMQLDSEGHKGRLMLVELKHGLDNTIQTAAEQIHEYFNVLTDAGKLRDEVGTSYREVVEQKRRLGVLPDNMRWPKEIVEVGCLVVLHGYNRKSRLLDRLRASLRGGHPQTWLVVLPEWNCDLPSHDKWEVL